jgi:Tol biopolymer transport system component
LAGEPFPVATAANGDRAWVDFNTGLAHLERTAEPGKEVTWPLEAQPGDKIYRAIAWVPGTDLLLAGYTQGGNAAMLLGPTLITLDTKTGAIKDLQTRLRADFQMQWHPAEKGVLLYAETGASDLAWGQRLALLNVITGQKSYPLPNQQASISWPSFTPDGKAAIFASYLPPEQAGPGHPLGALAIYQVTLAGGELKRLTTPPAGAQDEKPFLLADGVHFIYYRVRAADASTLTARLGSLDGTVDAALTAPLAAPPCFSGPSDCAWESVIAGSW